jgi:hypothetical protein
MAISQVVAVKTDGSPYNTVPPNVSGSGAGGNGGSVAKASNTNLLDGVSVSRYDAGVFGSSVVDTNDIEKVYGGGILAYNNPGPIAKKVTTELNGSANSVLLSGASQPDLIQSIHYIKACGMGCNDGVRTRRLTTAIREGHWNEYSGEFDVGYPVVAIDTFSQDDAARPTRDVPGELTYKTSSPEIVTDAYKKKTG